MSHTWRDVILYSLIFWNIILLSPGLPNMTLVKSHLERSRQFPLDIVIQSWQSSHTQLSVLLNIIVPHAHRWCTLNVC